MATQNSTITVKGKLGNIVGYKGRSGKRLARIRQTEVKNPKTEGQVIQRMIISTAARAYSRMKGIVDHSFQGVQYGGMSQSYFLKRACEDVRNWVAQTISITGEYPKDLRNPLLYRGLSYPKDLHQSGVGLLISEGTIASVPAVLTTPTGDEDPVFDHFGNLVKTQGENEWTCKQVMNALGAQIGDQITIVGLSSNGVFSASRYVIKSDATADELNESWPTSDIDGGPFDETKSSLSSLRLMITATGEGLKPGKITVVDAQRPTGVLYGLDAAAIIISRKVGDVWQRSTQRLVWLNDAGDYSLTDVVAAEWMAGTAQIDTVNPRYLNQAEQASL